MHRRREGREGRKKKREEEKVTTRDGRNGNGQRTHTFSAFIPFIM